MCRRQRDGVLARLLLEHGADPGRTASIWKGIRFVDDDTVHEYRDVTPVQYAQAFHHRRWVNDDAVEILESHAAT